MWWRILFNSNELEQHASGIDVGERGLANSKEKILEVATGIIQHNAFRRTVHPGIHESSEVNIQFMMATVSLANIETDSSVLLRIWV